MKPAAAKSKILAVVLLAGVLPGLVSLAAHLVFGATQYIQEPLHEWFELAGACIALGVAMLLLLRLRHDPAAPHLLWIAAGLVAMGVVDMIHGIAHFGVLWSWLRNGATLIGGVLFGLVWLPLPAVSARRRRSFIFLVTALAFAGSVAIWMRPGWLPTPWAAGDYSLAVKAANALGGLGFLAAAAFFCRRHLLQRRAEDLVFASHTLIFGTASLLFGFSGVWAADWWVWHIARLLAYTIVLIAAYEIVAALYQQTARHAQELEGRVRERTADLQLRNAQLSAEIAERQSAEAALREREQFINSVAAASPHWLYVFDFDSMGLSYENRSIIRDLGYPPDVAATVTGLELFREFMPLEERPHLARLLENWQELPEGRVRDDEYHLRHADGSLHTFAGREIVFERRSDGTVKRILGLVLDITAQKQAEELLRQFAADLQAANASLQASRTAALNLTEDAVEARRMAEVSSAELRRASERLTYLASFPEENPNPIMELDLDTNVRYANPAAQRLFPEAERRGWSHPWLADWATTVHPFVRGETRVVERDVTVDERIYRQALQYFPAEGFVRIYGFDITERRRAEEALAAALARYRSSLEVTGQLGWTTNADGEATEAMPAWRNFTGQSVEEIQGWGWLKALHPGDLERTAAVWRKAVQEKQAYETEYRVRRQDGVYRDFLARGIPVCNQDGSVREWVGTCIDITEHKLGERALAESESFYRQTLESIPGMTFTTRPDGYCDYQSQQWVDFTGVPMSEHVGDGWNKLLHPDDRPRAYEAWHAAVEGRAPYDLEYRVRRHDGAYEWFKVRGRPIRDVAGQIVRWFGTAVNIDDLVQSRAALQRARDELEQRVQERTEDLQKLVEELQREVLTRQRIEQSLRESEERYRTLFETAPVGIALTTFDGRALAMNHSMCAILGLESPAPPDVRLSAFYTHPGERSRLLAEAQPTGRLRDREVMLRRADGAPLIGLMQMDLLNVGGQSILLTMLEDITKRKKGQLRLMAITHLLELFPRTTSRKEYLDVAIRLIAAFCDCHGAGIRLVGEGKPMPYAAHVGFSRKFIQQEEALCLAAEECPCIRILRGRPLQSDGPFISERGSFYCSSASDCPGCVAGGDNAACLAAGYESIAHASIRYRDRVLGAIHLMDRRRGRFPAETVEFVESVSPLIGEAMQRFTIEEALGESEQRFRSLFERHDAVMLLVEPESGALVDVNPAAAAFYGYAPEQLRAMKLDDLNPAPPRSGSNHGAKTGDGQRGVAVVSHRLASGETRLVEVHSSPIQLQGRQLLFSILHDITERKRLEEQVLEISDQERRRFGQDLHDSLGGKLAGAALMSKALARTLAASSRPEAGLAEEIVQCINDSIGQTRLIARGLCPIELGVTGLVAALTELASETRQRCGVACRFTNALNLVIEDSLVATHLFRIAQEAVNNAVRHGQPHKVLIQLTRKGEQACLEIRDDGVGLPAKTRPASGLGLRTMKYRAGAIGGLLTVEPAQPKGTVVSCLAPLNSPSIPKTQTAK